MSKTAVVTGAGRGIGRAIAHRLAEAGHTVVLTDVEETSVKEAAAAVGHGAVGVVQDVRDPQSHRDLAEIAAARGQLLVWVNNAGVLLAGASWEHPDADLARILDVNIKGVMAGTSAAVRAMGTEGGAILNIASLSAFMPVPGMALYAATKAAVLSYTTSVQGDLRHAGLPIRVRALCPDVVNTAMVNDRAHDPGAALLFAGPKALDEDDVARAGLDLLESRSLVRTIPRWRGAMGRALDLDPAASLGAIAAVRRLGERRQGRH